jgi:NifB/MoaA-like Fe-S oxidoreductase
MFGLSLGFVLEMSVAILLATTIGYCVILNQRLKRLHADRDQLRKMVADLVQATTLANAAVGELKTTALEADAMLQARMQAAEAFGVELANHVNAGQQIMDKIARITTTARHSTAAMPESKAVEAPKPVDSRMQTALQQLAMRPRISGTAA